MDDTVVELGESVFVLCIVEWLRMACVGEGGFGQDELFHDLVKRIKANLKKVEFVKETKAIIDHGILSVESFDLTRAR